MRGKDTSREGFARRAPLAVLVLALAALGCGEDFSPFNVLDKLRVLAVQAEPPSLGPGETTTLSALVYEPDGDAINYSWSWCPLTAGRDTGYACAITEEQLREAAVEQGGELAGQLVPSFDLGDGETASFTHLVPGDTLRELCLALISEDIPEFVPVPECEDRITATIRLDVSAGGETVSAIKDLDLFFDAAGADNENPTLGPVEATLDDGPAIPLPADAAAALARDRAHDIQVTVPETAADSFVEDGEERRETLFMTWFVTGGRTEFTRTTFFEDDIPLTELGQNSWTTPETGPRAEIFFVLQDERGGVGWAHRGVALTEAGR